MTLKDILIGSLALGGGSSPTPPEPVFPEIIINDGLDVEVAAGSSDVKGISITNSGEYAPIQSWYATDNNCASVASTSDWDGFSITGNSSGFCSLFCVVKVEDNDGVTHYLGGACRVTVTT